MEPRKPPVGCRVLLGGQHLATVRYVGPIDGQQDIWVGIEYDEPGRGKHDGSHGDRRYFECAHGPTAGSFVRLAKLLETADLGRTLAAAAVERYAVGAAAEPLFVATAGNRRVAVELVAPEASSRRASGGGGVAAVLASHRIAAVVSAAKVGARGAAGSRTSRTGGLEAGWTCGWAAAALHTIQCPAECTDRGVHRHRHTFFRPPPPPPPAGPGRPAAGHAAQPDGARPLRQPACQLELCG